jgi:hypothetical protein
MIRFYLIEKRLLIDNRTNEIDGPMIKLVSRVSSQKNASETSAGSGPASPCRRSSRRLVARHGDAGDVRVWSAVVRMAESGFANSVRQCEEVLRELKEMERKVLAPSPAGRAQTGKGPSLHPVTSVT